MKAVLGVLLAALALSGCYVSKSMLLDTRQAMRVLQVGTFPDPNEPGDILDISAEPNGWYRFYAVGDDTADRILFTPLPGQDRILAMAWAEGDAKGGYLYGLAYPRRDGYVHLAGASCDVGAARQAAIAQGARITVSTSGSYTCEFRSRQALVAALAEYAKTWNWRTATTKLPAEIGARPR